MRDVITAAKVRKARRQRPAPIGSIPDDPGVKREIRLALFEKALDRLLAERENHDFVTFELRGRSESYVQYTLHDGALLGEVSSEGWIPEREPLDREQVTALGCLGFEGGGHRANLARDHLPQDARRLACLTELLFGAAYRPPTDFDITVVTKTLVEAQAAERRARRGDG